MSVYKPARSPFYHFDTVVNGHRLHGSTKEKTRREALRVEERERQKFLNGGRAKKLITLDEACGLYQDKVQDLPSWRNERRTMAAMIEGLGATKQLSEVEQTDLLHFFSKRRAGRKNASVNREIETCRAVWRWAAKAKYYVGDMPDWGALMLKVPRVDPRELSTVEEDSLFSEIRSDLYDFCLFALKSGWRLSEVLMLRWKDLNINAAVATTKIKGGDIIKRPLTQEMVITIANQPKVGPFVFTYVAQRNRPEFKDKQGRTQPARCKGERYPMTETVLRKPWARAKADAGVEGFRFHDLRHTRGTRMLRATGNIATAQKALGHRSIKTTLRYAHATDDDVRKALDASESRNIPEPMQGDSKKA